MLTGRERQVGAAERSIWIMPASASWSAPSVRRTQAAAVGQLDPRPAAGPADDVGGREHQPVGAHDDAAAGRPGRPPPTVVAGKALAEHPLELALDQPQVVDVAGARAARTAAVCRRRGQRTTAAVDTGGAWRTGELRRRRNSAPNRPHRGQIPSSRIASQATRCGNHARVSR